MQKVKIVILLLLLCIVFAPRRIVAQPMHILDSTITLLQKIHTAEFRFDRLQVFRSVNQHGSGQVWYDRDSKRILYRYTTPVSFSLSRVDSAFVHFDNDTGRGIHNVSSAADYIFSTDLFGWLIDIRDKKFSYRGVYDSTLVFKRDLQPVNSTWSEYIACDRQEYKIRHRELFHTNGTLLAQYTMYYDKGNNTALPDRVALRKVIGEEILLDSLTLKRVKTNKAIDSDIWKLPRNVVWDNCP